MEAATSSEAAISTMEIEKKAEVEENIEVENDETNNDNPQQRQDFTSESYKVEVTNMGKFSFGVSVFLFIQVISQFIKKRRFFLILFEIQEFRCLIKKLKLKPTKMKTKNHHGGKDHAYLCFRTIAEKDEALKIFDGFVWRGRQLRVKEAKPSLDPVLKRRLEEDKADENSQKAKKFKRKTVLEATAPLAHLPYPEQLKRKEAECIKHLQAYARAVKKSSLALRPMIQAQEKEKGLPCIWHGIKEAPNTNGYRNKCEFAIGKNENGETTVGFRLGSYCDGSVEVGSIQDLPHVPEPTKLAVKLFEAYIKSSEFAVFSVELYTGQFRQLSVRVSESTGEIMLIVGIHTSEITEKVEELTEDIVNYFTEREGKELNVTSIYIEEMNKREVGQTYNKIQHVHGSKYINDTILGLKFRISAAAFFQINTKSAEVLYDLAMKMGRVDSSTSVLDICCGTGTIGLCFAKVIEKICVHSIEPDECFNSLLYFCISAAL